MFWGTRHQRLTPECTRTAECRASEEFHPVLALRSPLATGQGGWVGRVLGGLLLRGFCPFCS